MAGIHQMFVRIAKMEDPDQNASSDEIWAHTGLVNTHPLYGSCVRVNGNFHLRVKKD